MIRKYFPVLKNPIVFVTIVLSILFIMFAGNLKSDFDRVNLAYENNTVINLNQALQAEELSSVLISGAYVFIKNEALLISEKITEQLYERKSIPNLYELNKHGFHIPIALADSLGGVNMKKRVETSYRDIGVNSYTKSMHDRELDNIIDISHSSMGEIAVIVREVDTTTNVVLKRLNLWNKKPVSNVLIQLKKHYYNAQYIAQDSVLGYAKTNKDGIALFKGLDTACYYSVLPIKEKYEFGRAKGTIGGSLGSENKGKREFAFMQKEHTIRLFDNSTYQQIRSNKVFTVRTPAEYKNILFTCLICFFIAWWGLYFMLIWKKKEFSRDIIALLMFLTGYCLLIMFSIHQPLSDKLRGVDMAIGIIVGIMIIGLLQWVDFLKFYQDKSKIKFDFMWSFFIWLFFKSFRKKIQPLTKTLRSNRNNGLTKLLIVILIIVCTPLIIIDLLQLFRLIKKMPNRHKGIGFSFAAILLTIFLFTPFGREVGGMKVNLNLLGFVFQPSEIVKYLIIFYFAAYFCRNAETIIKYSESGNVSFFSSKIKTLFGILVSLCLLIITYLILGDMGPALVLGVTFVILYSIVKSKISLDNLSETDKYTQIFTCDVAMLIYGVISFVLMLFGGEIVGAIGISCMLWFVLWLAFGIIIKKQIFESAILLNIVIAAFIFGGTILNQTPLHSVGDRLEQRKEICVNTWGNLGLSVDEEQETCANDQIAQGLWGIASGGLYGQGLGKGNPNLIPAFHTDMILESIGEQMGWLGLLVIVISLALLLRKSIIIGFQSAHPFAFYLTMGISVVTGVQFLIIALGSTGVIPLTGVTVPFLSFGKVSMILNLAVFGVILSLAQKRGEVNMQQRKNIDGYNYPTAIISVMYSLLAMFILFVFSYYQIFNQDKTLTHPLFVHTSQGVPSVEYNPRIKLILDELCAGNIYDRNNVILATSDKTSIDVSKYIRFGIDGDNIGDLIEINTKRYYPFGDNLLFMLGDYNTNTLFNYNESNPIGYLAEQRHLAALRGFNNILYDKETDLPLTVDLISEEYRPNLFLYPINIEHKGVKLRDYSDSDFLVMLRDGVDGKSIDKWNIEQKRNRRDIQLTIDAELQTKMQNAIHSYVKHNLKDKKWNKLRISVVVLNAKNGELLASANYPLPSQEIIKNKIDDKIFFYSDNKTDKDFKAYVDRDLGLTYQTAPGSTAKIMSALAGFKKLGTDLKERTYYIDAKEVLNSPYSEPNYQINGHYTTLEEAIRLSSNCYFINLINDCKLYEQLGSIYATVGIRIGDVAPYSIYRNKNSIDNEQFRKVIYDSGQDGVNSYDNYIEKRKERKEYKKMNNAEWQWAWGQGNMDASPLNMSRVVSIVANDGKMLDTKYVLKGNDDLRVPMKMPSTQVVSDAEANILKEYMRNETNKHKVKHNYDFPNNMGGKTGTAQRIIQVRNKVTNQLDEKTMNDGWYMFFIESSKENAPLSIAVRMERLPGGNSSMAVRLTDKIIIRVLQDLDYIDN